MIPPFTDTGVLPPGVYEADDWAQVVTRFGGTPRRDELLRKLRRGLDNLRDAGCPWVLLDGSFVTDKEEPNDVDGCWEFHSQIDRKRLDLCFLPTTVPEKRRQFRKYGMDFYRAASVEAGSRRSFAAFFQTGRDGRPKGIVRLDLVAEMGRLVEQSADHDPER